MSAEENDEVCIQVEPFFTTKRFFFLDPSHPCFRNTYLYSIFSGLGVGLSMFMLTSHGPRSAKYGSLSFLGTFVVYLISCDYRTVKEKFDAQRLQYVYREYSENFGIKRELPFENGEK